MECAANGVQALEKARLLRPDIIVSDVMMPEMDGITLCTKTRADEALKNIPIILYSAAYYTDDEKAFALSQGAAGFLVRPSGPGDFLESAHEILGNSKIQNPPVGTTVSVENNDGKNGNVSRTLVKKLKRKILELGAARWELEKTDSRYGALFKNMPGGVAYCRMICGGDGAPSDWICLDTNNAFERLTGLKDVKGCKVSKILPSLKADNPELFEIFGRVALGDRSETFEIYIKPLSRWFHIAAFSPEKDYFVGIFEDITWRRKAENSLRQFAAVMDESRDAIIECSVEGEILNWNKGARKIFGYADEEVIGRSMRELFSPECRKDLPGLLKSIREGIPQANYSSAWLRKDGTRVELEFSISPMRGMDGLVTGASIVGRDITRRKAAEARQARTDAELRQSQKIEVAGRLANGIAHDFNNILMAISGYSELALNALPENDQVRMDIEEIKSAAERAACLTKQLLAFSRKQVLDLKVLDIGKVVADMRNMLQRLIGEDIKMTFTPAPEPALAKADLGHMQQVILNLAVNARDAMPEGGKLSVSVGAERLEAPCFHVSGTVPAGSYTTLSVADTGCGMSDEVKSHIFEPFFTTKEHDKGTGLGLSTIYGIIKQSNGHMALESAPGKGTAFKIYLPQAMPVPYTAEPEPLPDKLFKGTATILLVDDDKQIRDVGRRMLTAEGFTVLEAENGAEALDICKNRQSPVHLMLTDMVMPEMSGAELAARLVGRWPRLKVVFMSGYTDHAVLENGKGDAAKTFIQKPFSLTALVQIVKEVLAS